ncbi:FAD-binding protein [Kamptonema formosum]|uniref:FAD-binding protein n=1 Tax=Kamptonema formosum TaxID=331992 RepID=UPI00034566A9|nr:FAD-binding protein [Oscillatoria sp. PCC 10802]
MKNNISGSSFLQDLIACAPVIGFDPVSRSWVTSAGSVSEFEALSPLDGVLCAGGAVRAAAADDFGHIVSRQPAAVLKPGSIEDIARTIKFSRTHKFKVVARGQGHTTGGQSQVDSGTVTDMSELNAIHSISAGRIEVDAGVLWGDLLQAAQEQQLTPHSLTDYLDLSVGGTLSAGGIGGATYLHGLQADNVLELQVVTGEGNLETCSPSQKPDLFSAVLAGWGQCGIIVRAAIKLIPAETRARVFHLFYDNLAAFLGDQRLLIAGDRFNFVEGQVVPSSSGGWEFVLQAVRFYTPPALPDNTRLLAGLSCIPGREEIEDKSYFEHANRLAEDVAALKSLGLWSCPHPWINLFVPGTAVERYVGDILSTLTPADTGGGPVLLYPVKTERFKMPLFRAPGEPVVFLFAMHAQRITRLNRC